MSSARNKRSLTLWKTIAAIGAIVGIAGCGPRPDSRRAIELADCRLPKLATSVRCGTLSVPEDRSRPQGRAIDIFVAVLPANTVSPKPDPLVILAGGPGQAASQLAPLALRLGDVRRLRDIVLIDQRGTGRSSPLKCAALAPDDDLGQSIEVDSAEKAVACLGELRKSGADVTQYTTGAWIADIEAVRAALGYPQLNLWGGSYGTRVALEYLRQHPERVRTLVLDGVAGPDVAVPRDAWHSRERALDAVLDACAATESCRRAHPDLRGTLDRLLVEYAKPGTRVEIVDPRTGASRPVTMTSDLLLAGIHALSYVPERAALLPVVLDRALSGDFAPLAAAAQSIGGDLVEQMSPALHYAVICSEDAPRVSADDRKALAGLRSAPLAARMLEVCERWPRGAAAPPAPQAVKSDVPALLLSGALDPVTPPENAAQVAATLPASRHVVVGGGGHIVSAYACVPRLIAAFVESADASSLPRSCIEFLEKSRRSPLWPDRMGPQP